MGRNQLELSHFYYLLRLVVIAALYYGSGKLVATYVFIDFEVPFIWPPAGIALAAVLIGGYHYLPGIVFGSLLLMLTSGFSALPALGAAMGSVLGAFLGAYLLRLAPWFDDSMERIKYVIGFVVIGAVLSSIPEAAARVLILQGDGLSVIHSPLFIFGKWWLAQFMGVLIITPVALLWSVHRIKGESTARLIEAAALLILLGFASTQSYTFGLLERDAAPVSYLVFPFIIWAAVRFSVRGAATAVFIVTSAVIFDVVRRYGDFNNAYPLMDMNHTHVFLALVALSALLTAAAVHERRPDEKGLGLRDEVYGALLESAGAQIFIIDPETRRISEASSGVEKTLGYSSSEIIGMSIDDIERPGGEKQGEAEGGLNLRDEKFFRRKDGTFLPVVTSSGLIEYGGRKQVMCVVRDVSEPGPPSAEQTPDDSEEMNKMLFESLLYGAAKCELVYMEDEKPVDSRILDVNSAYETLTGIKREDAVGKRVSVLFNLNKDPNLDLIDAIVSRGKPTHFDTYFKPLNKHFNVSILPSKRGRYTAIYHDITLNKVVEVALRESEERLELTLRSIRDGVVALDSKGRIVFANRAGRQYLELMGDAEVGERLTHLGKFPIEDLIKHSGVGKTFHEITLEEDSERVFEVSSQSMDESNSAKGEVLVIREVTEERAIRKSIEGQSRLAAVGQLAAGIAHDFNNILTVMIGYIDLVLYSKSIPENVRSNLNLVIDQGKKASKLISQILDFSRRSVSERLRLDLLPFLKDNLKLFERTIPESVRIVTEFYPGEYWVLGSSPQLQQILTNLAANAGDAMPGGGKLFISLRHVDLPDKKSLPFPQMSTGRWVKLSISDTGSGISKEHIPHIFEPFFTTKGPGEGTGLGLAQVYGLVKQHEGFIDVESDGMSGTTFNIYLPPPTSAPQHEEEETDESTKILKGGGETILLVEDEPLVLETTKNMLEGLGYNVLTASNGKEALEIFYNKRSEIDLVVTDMVMPEVDGAALLRELKETAPHQKALVMTGYPLGEESRNLLTQGRVKWIQKPLDLIELSRIIGSLLTTREADVINHS
ncbi:MAG: MASE1 domain-containing protein [Candidatus Dadabacteria bacterium]|nr:MASE1 domain-containing protein [Candidatus Dadabacteria bacterium]